MKKVYSMFKVILPFSILITSEKNYANPFNSVTTISFNVQEATYVSLKVYDVTSKVIATLVDERKNAGQYSVKWDAGNMSSGVY